MSRTDSTELFVIPYFKVMKLRLLGSPNKRRWLPCITHMLNTFYVFSQGSAQRCTIKESYLVFSLRSFQCRDLILEVIDLSSEWIVGGIWRYKFLFLLSLWFSESVAGVSFCETTTLLNGVPFNFSSDKRKK